MNFRNESADTLLHHGVKPTAVRLLIYDTLARHTDTFSLADLETELDSVERSTIFRALTLFTEKGLLHEIEDGSGSKKFCLCRHQEDCNVGNLHCHFYCQHCKRTFCLDHTQIPVVSIPDGFRLLGIDYLMKGICSDCESSAKKNS